jgi:hypothetical protein
MSLLTNEQIAELVGIASNQSTSKDLYEEFHEWNEKQIPSIEFEPDWGKAPRGAEEAVLELHWLDRNGNKFAWDLFGYFERHKGETK